MAAVHQQQAWAFARDIHMQTLWRSGARIIRNHEAVF